MKLINTFLHMDHTEALDKLIQHKTVKLERHLSEKAEVRWISWLDKGTAYSEIRANDGREHYTVTAHAESLYQSIDLAIDKLLRRIEHRGDRRKSRNIYSLA